MLTPSSVMLIVPCGRPLIVESRLPPGVDTPGRKLTKSIALRLVSGSFVIWLVLIVVETVDDCVCTISDDGGDGHLLGDAADFERRLARWPARRRQHDVLDHTVLNPGA